MSAYTIDDLKAEFTAKHPQLQRMAMAHFHHGFGLEARDEMTQEALAITWRWIAQRHARGEITGSNAWRAIKDSLYFAILHVIEGRPLPGNSGQRGPGRADAYERMAPIHVEHCSIYFIADQTPVPDQVAFRIDFPAFLATLTERQRGIIGEMIQGTDHADIAHMFGVTRGRISQMRNQFKTLMDRFYGE